MIPEEAIEAVAKLNFEASYRLYREIGWDELEEDHRAGWLKEARDQCEAAAPFIRAQALMDAADELAIRSETFLKTMQNMADSREYKLEDIVRYGAFSAEANTTANRLRARAVTERGGE